MNEPDNKKPVFSDETIEALREFGEVLQQIHDRLLKEGKTIELDDHYKPKNQD